jgi:cathepsin A (carboxypeptidase C)
MILSQPAGTGLSTVKNTSKYPHDLRESSADFSNLLDVFFKEIFPRYSQNELYIAGESFAGRYIPKFAFDITQKRNHSAQDSLSRNLNGIILVDALVDAAAMFMGHYEMFCTDKATILHFNHTTCQTIAKATSECAGLIATCEQLHNANICQSAEEYCEASIGRFYQEEVDQHRRSPYDCESHRNRRTSSKSPT